MLVIVAVLAGGATEASAQLGALMSPGRLHKTHASLESAGGCLQCHTRGRQVSAEKCLLCHKPVAARMASQTGVHRSVTTDCISCHVEHLGADADLRAFAKDKFDHTRDTPFPLEGLHTKASVTCESCHKTRSFLTATTTCASCHADPHKGSLGQGCTTCHSTTVPFASALTAFDHRTAAFPLSGSHAKVACASCHANKKYKGVPFASCSSCHVDPHKAQMGATCASCHTDASWRTTRVDHSRTAFPLKGQHAVLACAKCHVKPATVVKVRSDTCAACHADPHAGTFRQDCGSCHTESSFLKGTFDHGTTTFPLVEKHAGLTCVSCHKNATPKEKSFKGLTTTCQSCHSDVHQGELGEACQKCHTSSTFIVAAFSHTRPRPFFAGRHSSLTCAQCHAQTLQPSRTGAGPVVLRTGFTTTPTSCVSCHKDVHLGQMKQSCDTCHSVDTPGFSTTGFSHNTTVFPLTGQHAPLKCEVCHKIEFGTFPAGAGTARRFASMGTTCASCHQDPHAGQVGQTCETCHTTGTFALPNYRHRDAGKMKTFMTGRHAAAGCDRCHKPLPLAASGTKPRLSYQASTTCTACHEDVHRGALGPDCATCHKP